MLLVVIGDSATEENEEAGVEVRVTKRQKNEFIEYIIHRIKYRLGCQACGAKKKNKRLRLRHVSIKNWSLRYDNLEWWQVAQELEGCTILCINCNRKANLADEFWFPPIYLEDLGIMSPKHLYYKQPSLAFS